MIKVVKTIEDQREAVESGVCYISGPISGVNNYRENFARAESLLFSAGMLPINPAYMPDGLPYDDYFPTCYAQIRISNALCFLSDYEKSTGAAREAKRANLNKKEYWAFTLKQFQLMNCLYSLPDTFADSPEGTKAMKETARKREDMKKAIAREGCELEAWIAKVNPPKTEIQILNDKVKRVLRSYLDCQHQIDTLCDEITKLDSRRKRITIQYRDVHGGSGSDYTEAVIDNIKELEDKIILQTKRLQSERAKVQYWIDGLEDYRERNVLNMCYINGMSFEQIAEKLSYEYGYVRKLHGWGIGRLRELMKEKNALS